MGAAASFDDRLPAKIDLPTYQKLVGNTKEMHEVFTKLAVDGIITREIFIENARKRTHVFLTHDWGKDEKGRDNHARVSKVNDWLKSNGVITWFDSDRMTGRVVQTMFDGIDNCCVIIVFATRNYIDKVGGKNGDGDNCLKEFNYADMRKTTKNMHVVVHEAGCRNPKTWDGTMGLLAGKLYDDNVEDEKFEDNMQSLLKTIKGMIPPELFALTTMYGEKSSQEKEVVMLAPVEAAPLLGLTDEEEEKREEDGMFEWMRQYSPEISSKKARKAAHAFVKQELTIKKIAKKMEKSMTYLKDNFDLLDDDDIEEFVNGLKQAGLLGGGDAVAMTPSSPSGVMVTSTSAPVVLTSTNVVGTTVASIDPTEADAIGAELIAEYSLCVASVPLLEKYELKAIKMAQYPELVKAQKLEEVKVLGMEIKAMGPCTLPDGFSSMNDVIRRILAVRQKIDARRLALLADTSAFENFDRVVLCMEYSVKVDAYIKEKGWLFEGIKDGILTGHSEYVSCITEISAGVICSSSFDKTIKLWDIRGSGTCIKTFTGHTERVWAVILLSDGRICSAAESIKIWNISSGSCVLSITGHSGSVISIIQLSDGRICSGSVDETIKLWNISDGSCVQTCKGHTKTVYSLTQLINGRICSGSDDSTLKVWDISNGSCLLTLSGHASAIRRHTQLNDGRICSASSDKTIKIWDITNGSCMMTLSGHTGTVFYVLQLIDGRLCSASGDKTIKIWDISSGLCLLSLTEHTGEVYCLLKLSNGKVCSGAGMNADASKIILWK